jgi:hypothetical protein
MTSYQNAVDYAKDQMQLGKLTASQANVFIVQMMGVRVITCKIPSDVRKALNEAVKNGELGYLKKDGMKPEVYHHKNARKRALEEQREIERESIDRLKNCFA